VALDWLPRPRSPTDTLGDDTPVVLVLHGLTGGTCEPHVRWLLKMAQRRRWRAVLLNSRGCSGCALRCMLYASPNKLDASSGRRSGQRARKRPAGVPGFCLALHRLSLCGSPTYLLTPAAPTGASPGIRFAVRT